MNSNNVLIKALSKLIKGNSEKIPWVNDMVKIQLLNEIRIARIELLVLEPNEISVSESLERFIEETISCLFSVEHQALLHKNRSNQFAHARYFIFYFKYRFIKKSQQEITRPYSKGHDSFWQAKNFINNIIDTKDKKYYPYFEKIISEIMFFKNLLQRNQELCPEPKN